MKQDIIAQFVQRLKHWLCNALLSVVMENWAFPIDQWQLQFLVHLINLLSTLPRCNGFLDSESCSGSDLQQITKQWPWTFFGASLTLPKCLVSVLKFLLGPATELVITSCRIKSSFPHRSQSNQEMVHCCCIELEKVTLHQWFFWPSISSWGTCLSSFFTFPVCFKCRMTVEWSTLSSSATSHIAIRESASMVALSCHCQLLIGGHCTPHLQGTHLLCRTTWTTTAWDVL